MAEEQNKMVLHLQNTDMKNNESRLLPLTVSFKSTWNIEIDTAQKAMEVL